MNNLIFENRIRCCYYMNEKGIKFELYEYLNCIEKIIFYQMVHKNVYCYDKFIADINICLKSEESQHYVKPYAKAQLEDFVYIEKEIPNTKLQAYVENALDKDILGFSTYFDLLNEYSAYNPKSQGTDKGHVSTLVAYDSKYYYLVDDPAILNMNFIKKCPLNAQVQIIEKNELLRTFEKHVVFYKIRLKNINYSVSLIEVLRQSLNNYKQTKFPSNMIWGHRAYEVFLRELNSGHFNYYENYFKTWWDLQIILAKREILKLYLQHSEDDFKHVNLIELLRVSVKRWTILRNVVMRNNIVPSCRFQKMVKDMVLQISEIEDLIMREIECLLTTSSINY